MGSFRRQYGRAIPVSQLCYKVSQMLHAYTRHDAVRPFGCSLIFSSWLEGKPELWTLDPSGAAFGYRGAAAGKAKNNARTEIEKIDFDKLTADHPKHERVPADVAKAAEDAAKAELADSDSED